MDDITFKVNKDLEYINGEITYNNNEFVFESNSVKGEFSLMLGRGYCELSITRVNSRINSFGGINIKEDWISNDLVFPSNIKGELHFISSTTDINSYDGTWYVENWNTYYDEKNNYICMGDCDTNSEDIIAVEFCKNIIAVTERGNLRSIWIRNINFKS